MSKLGITVVGAGLIGRKHIALIGTSPATTLVAIVDPSAAARELSDSLAVPHFNDFEASLQTSKPDAVIIAAPNALHVSLGLICIRHGLPMLMEKPIAETIESAGLLVEASEQSGVPLLVGHHRRHNPVIAAARKAVLSGILGKLVAVSGSATFYKPDQYFRDGVWRTVSGGGPILLNMTHEVDNLRFICGDIDAVQAISSSKTRGFDVEDTAVINFRFKNGALGNFVVSDTTVSVKSWEQTSKENSDYPNYPDENCYCIMGSEGSLDIPSMHFTKASGERSWWRPVTQVQIAVSERNSDPYVRQLDHFISVARGKTKPIISGRDALKTLHVTLAILEAAKSGNTVHCAEAQLVAEPARAFQAVI